MKKLKIKGVLATKAEDVKNAIKLQYLEKLKVEEMKIDGKN